PAVGHLDEQHVLLQLHLRARRPERHRIEIQGGLAHDQIVAGLSRAPADYSRARPRTGWHLRSSRHRPLGASSRPAPACAPAQRPRRRTSPPAPPATTLRTGPAATTTYAGSAPPATSTCAPPPTYFDVRTRAAGAVSRKSSAAAWPLPRYFDLLAGDLR